MKIDTPIDSTSSPPLHASPRMEITRQCCHKFPKSSIVTQLHHDDLGAEKGEEEAGDDHLYNIGNSRLS